MSTASLPPAAADDADDAAHADAAWRRARDLFLDLADLPPEERAVALARLRGEDPELCAWVERLLDNDPGGVVAAPRRFGPYEAIRRIAAGGMGEVHLARRVDGEFEREVAVKLIRPGVGGEELVRRFLRERQTLARLEHEYVARLLDGGTTDDGQPYLVMEYVDGRPLDVYCREEDLSREERLRLFLALSSAVRHAHERGVVHRDLKPGNVLVRADGTPRLLDFGIARPTAPDATSWTGAGRLFTPEFASPEQVRGGDVTERTDVFALGVLLYLLLTDELPWRAAGSLPELERQILEEEPPAPSRRRSGTERRALLGDLDTIVLKCLAKEPRWRYASVAELADDVERHLGGFPIRARRTGLLGRAARYGRRKPSVAVAITAVVLSLGVGAALWRTRAAGRERRAQLADSVDARLEAARDLRVQGRHDEAARELEEVLATLEGLPGETYLRARALADRAVLNNHRRVHDQALADARAALALVPEGDPRAVKLRASLLNSCAYAARMGGDQQAGWAAAQEALDYARAHLDYGDELAIDALLEMADNLGDRRDEVAFDATMDEIVRRVRSRGVARDRDLASALNLWGLHLAATGRHEDALAKLDEALEILAWHYGEGHSDVAQLHNNLGESLRLLDRLDEAQGHFDRALATFQELGREYNLGLTRTHLADLAFDRGRWAEAAEHLRLADEHLRRHLGEGARALTRIAYRQGRVHVELGELDEARADFERALLGDPSIASYGAQWEGPARYRYGAVLLELGRADEGRSQLEAAVPLLREAFGEDHADLAAARALLAG